MIFNFEEMYEILEDKPILKKFKKNPRYLHKRSEGLTRRSNSGTRLQYED